MAVSAGSGGPRLDGGSIRRREGIEATADHEASLIPEYVPDGPDLAGEAKALPQQSGGGEGTTIPELREGQGHQVDLVQPTLKSLDLVPWLKPDPKPPAARPGHVARKQTSQADNGIASHHGLVIAKADKDVLDLGEHALR